jgi:hypothetical protein
MPKFPVDAPKSQVIKALENLVFAWYAKETTLPCCAKTLMAPVLH